MPLQPARDPEGDQRDECPDEEPAHHALPCRVGHRPQQVPLPRPAEGPRLEGEAALLDIGQRCEDHRPDERQDASEAGAEAALGVETTGPLALSDHRGPLDERRHRLDRRDGDEGGTRRHPAPLEIEHERSGVGGQDEQPDRGRDGEQPEHRLRGEVDTLDRRVERADLEDDRGPRSSEDADENDRDGDRQGQQERGTDEASQDAAPRGEDEHDRHDRDRADVAAEEECTDRGDRGDDGLGQWVQPVIRTGRRRDEPGDECGVVRVEIVGPDEPGRRRRVYSASSPSAFSPCGNRATNRRDRVWSRTKTMRNVNVLSIGSEMSPCWRTAVCRSAPACWNAATRRSVPEPVTPPKTTAAMGAEMMADTIPQMSPAIATYATPMSRRTTSRRMSPMIAAMIASAMR